MFDLQLNWQLNRRLNRRLRNPEALVKHSAHTRLIALSLCVFMAACSAQDDETDILDAAALYGAHPDAFVEILLSYPGPFTEFTRIPARNSANERDANTRFLKNLRKTMPVEFIDFFPRSPGGRDEINVMIKRYAARDDWVAVSIIYLSKPLSAPNEGENKALFERCDERSLTWLGANKDLGPATAICQLDENWYAVQKVE